MTGFGYATGNIAVYRREPSWLPGRDYGAVPGQSAADALLAAVEFVDADDDPVDPQQATIVRSRCTGSGFGTSCVRANPADQACDSLEINWRSFAPEKIASWVTSGMPRRIAVAATQRSASWSL